jgi:hypothetical protein
VSPSDAGEAKASRPAGPAEAGPWPGTFHYLPTGRKTAYLGVFSGENATWSCLLPFPSVDHLLTDKRSHSSVCAWHLYGPHHCSDRVLKVLTQLCKAWLSTWRHMGT